MKRIIKKVIKGVIITLSVILIIFLGLLVFVSIKLKGNYENLRKIDNDGYLYYLDYTGDYYQDIINLPITLISEFGCSAFITQDNNNDSLTFRNYDLAHKDKDGNVTGLNVIVRLKPDNKYQSINVCDACWLSSIKLPYYKNSLNKDKDYLLLSYLPYFSMDGINEKGLCCSILALDLKEGETAVDQNDKNKDNCNILQLLRYSLDNCKDVNEVIELANKYNMKSVLGYDYHLFVTDENNNSVVLEWRNNELKVTKTDAVTNFYVGFTDASDVYKNGEIKEKYIPLEGLSVNYNMGYGHGYNRFKTLVKKLDQYRTNDDSDNKYKTKMDYKTGLDLISSVKQGYDGGLITSYTQYTCCYNNTKKQLDVYLPNDYNTKYSFSFND